MFFAQRDGANESPLGATCGARRNQLVRHSVIHHVNLLGWPRCLRGIQRAHLVTTQTTKKVKVAHTRLPSVGFPVLGSQSAGDVSHKPGGRLPLLSARPTVTLATLKRAVTSGVLLKMEVGISKGAWRRAWRYPAYLWSLRWVYAVKKNPGVGIPPNTPLAVTNFTAWWTVCLRLLPNSIARVQ